VVIECDNVTRFTVNESINDVVVRDLSKPLSDDCLIKSVSTPGSHKSPFRLPVKSIDLYDNRLPKDLTCYKPIKMSKNRDYLVGKYNYISSDQNHNILTDLYILDFDSLCFPGKP